MEETVFLKFTQHEDLKDELLRTGNAELIEVSNVPAHLKHVFMSWFHRILQSTVSGVLGPMEKAATSSARR